MEEGAKEEEAEEEEAKITDPPACNILTAQRPAKAWRLKPNRPTDEDNAANLAIDPCF